MRILVTLAVCLILSSTLRASEAMVPYFDGVPVMPGFTAAADEALIFDKPEGRVIEITAWCDADCPPPQDIKSYYKNALTGLGWHLRPGGEFAKDQDTVHMEILQDERERTTIIVFRSNG